MTSAEFREFGRRTVLMRGRQLNIEPKNGGHTGLLGIVTKPCC